MCGDKDAGERMCLSSACFKHLGLVVFPFTNSEISTYLSRAWNLLPFILLVIIAHK